MLSRNLITEIASTLQAMRNCEKSGNAEWLVKHRERLEQIQRNDLPSGSGLDSGTTIDLDKSTSTKIVLHTSFHHMNDAGMYDGWTEHTLTITPAFGGIDIKIGGRDRNGIKEYLHEVFYYNLTAQRDVEQLAK